MRERVIDAILVAAAFILALIAVIIHRDLEEWE